MRKCAMDGRGNGTRGEKQEKNAWDEEKTDPGARKRRPSARHGSSKPRKGTPSLGPTTSRFVDACRPRRVNFASWKGSFCGKYGSSSLHFWTRRGRCRGVVNVLFVSRLILPMIPYRREMLSSNVQIFDNEVRRTSATTRESWREGDFFVGVLYRNMCIYLFQKDVTQGHPTPREGRIH